MQIVSTIASTGRREHFFVCDTFADGKSFTTAVVQALRGLDQLTEIGQQTRDFALAHHDAQHKQRATAGAIHLVEVFAPSTARQKALNVFSAADDGDCIVFFGRTDAVCAAFTKVLGLRGFGGRQ